VSETSASTPIADVVQGYFTMWNETDPDRRRQAIASTWSPEASYLDPLFEAGDPMAMEEMVLAVHQRFPGHRFRRTDAVDAHHDRARWGWELVSPDGDVVAAGVDFAVLAADGRLRQVTGFLEPPASAA
jgi:ketosteroid isomerase-like protein